MDSTTGGTAIVGYWYLTGRSVGRLDATRIDPVGTAQFQQEVGRFPSFPSSPPAPAAGDLAAPVDIEEE